jgi:hypothetical protein
MVGDDERPGARSNSATSTTQTTPRKCRHPKVGGTAVDVPDDLGNLQGVTHDLTSWPS